MQVHIDGHGPVALSPDAFVGQGSEGSVYAWGSQAVKVWTDPARVVPEAKLLQLASLGLPAVAAPTALVRDRAGAVVGYVMPFFAQARPAASVVPPIARQRLGLTLADMLGLVGALASTLRQVHRAQCAVVDLSENNLLVDLDAQRLVMIDVDSWQVDRWPATAITDAVRDRRAVAGTFGPDTDWFSFAVVSFALLVGMHPFRGSHPILRGLDVRMDAGVSVFDPAVVLPRSVLPLDQLPGPWRAWYEAVFQRGHRGPPPGEVGWVVPGAVPRVQVAQVRSTVLQRAPGAILAVSERSGVRVVVTAKGVWLDARQVAHTPPGVDHAVLWCGHHPVVCALDGDRLRLVQVRRDQEVELPLSLREVCVGEGRLMALCGDQLVEILLHQLGDQVVAAAQPVAQVLAHGTACLRGLAVQDLRGACWVSLFPAVGGAPQVRVRELDGRRWVGGVLAGHVAVGVLEAPGGSYERVLLRFDAAWQRYELIVDKDVPLHAPQAVALASGAVVLAEPDDALLLLRDLPGDGDWVGVPDGAAGLTLLGYRGGLAAVYDGDLWTLSLSPSG